MHKTFGVRTAAEQGLLAPIHFPQLALSNTRTADGRQLVGEGGGVRTLPVTLYAQTKQSAMGGHDGSVVVGRLDYVEFHDNDIISGDGWLVDTEDGRLAYVLASTGALRRNSVDLTDTKVKVDVRWDDDGDYSLVVDFTEWNIGATTLVGKSAFADARAEVGELTASLFGPDGAGVQLDEDGNPAVITIETEGFDITFEEDSELSASLAAKLSELGETPFDIEPAAPFFVDEPDTEQPITLNLDGTFSGHLGAWNRAHRALRRFIPRSRNQYAGLLKPGPFVRDEHGEVHQVSTAPLFLVGGHPDTIKGMSDAEIAKAYGGVENAWGDYRIVDGKIGPWISGRMRKSLSEEKIQAAQCSPISGHWLGDDLMAIISVNTPAFEVQDNPGARPSFQVSHDSDGTRELVASFAPPLLEVEAEETPAESLAGQLEAAVTMALEKLGLTPAAEEADEAGESSEDLEDLDLAAELMLLEIQLEDEDNES